MPARTRAYVYILISVAIWGVAGVVIKSTLHYLDTITFLTLRFGLTSLILVPTWLWQERNRLHLFPKLSKRDWGWLAVTGLCSTTIQLLLTFWGFERTTAIEGTLISSMAPIFVALAGHHFLKDRITKIEQIGMFIALVGTLMVVGLPKNMTNVWGNLLVLMANLVWTAEAILSKKLLRLNLEPFFLTTAFFLIGFITMLPIYLLSNHQPITTLPLIGWFGFLYMVFLSGMLAYTLFYKGQKTIEASEANTFMYLQPLFATPVAYFWLKESVSTSFILGGLVVTVGVLIATLKLRRPDPLP